jgi:hypothetical protein
MTVQENKVSSKYVGSISRMTFTIPPYFGVSAVVAGVVVVVFEVVVVAVVDCDTVPFTSVGVVIFSVVVPQDARTSTSTIKQLRISQDNHFTLIVCLLTLLLRFLK